MLSKLVIATISPPGSALMVGLMAIALQLIIE